MPRFVTTFRYQPETWNSLRQNPQQNQQEQVSRAAQSVSANVIEMLYTPGADYDGIVITECPNLQSAQALSAAIQSAGHIKSSRTTQALTQQEMSQSLQQAQKVTSYQSPQDLEQGSSSLR